MSTLTGWTLTRFAGSDAAYIANDFGGDHAPKNKFIFTVEFGFRSLSSHKGSKELDKIEYDLKSASRPIISINQEDINYYNYRTKVATRTNFGTIKLSFYEDSLNNSNNLLWDYMRSISPLTISENLSISTEGDSVTAIPEPSTIGALSHPDGPIAWMKVHHHYLNGTTRKITTYTCSNPKIESVEFDELDMSSNEASIISAVFTVDAISVTQS